MIKTNWRFILICSLLPLMAACTVSRPNQPAGATPGPTQTPASETDLPPQAPDDDLVSQWAQEAEAGSSFSDPEWSAQQATGRPDTFRCGDLQTAWASAAPDSVDWLELQYETAVYVTAVNVHQSFNPNQVAQVQLIAPDGEALTIYERPPVPVDQPCPFTLSVEIEKTERRYAAVRLSVDQSSLGLGWNEIDAVELVGVDE